MANFEGLIRGALAAKGATTEEMRAVVYQSSRNALQRLIAENRSLTIESVVAEQQALEQAISRVEADFAEPIDQFAELESAVEAELSHDFQTIQPNVSAQSETEPPELTVSDYEQIGVMPDNTSSGEYPDEAQSVIPNVPDNVELGTVDVTPETDPAELDVVTPERSTQADPKDDPFYELEQVLASPTVAPPIDETSSENAEHSGNDVKAVSREVDYDALAVTPQPAENPSDTFGRPDVVAEEPLVVPPAFKRRRKSQAWIWFIFAIAILAVIGWVGYQLALGVMDGSLFGFQEGNKPVVSRDVDQKDGLSDYIQILEPGDLTAMVASDRGRVEIINEQSLEMIRILSVRDKSDRSRSAKPILIRLKPGVLEQIKGKRVTAEIYARSGTSQAAQFAVECLFGQGVGCGRKRFHVGVQPEVSIFAFTLDENRPQAEDAFIAINTDITHSADVTGEGDVLDIVFVRLRTAKEESS